MNAATFLNQFEHLAESPNGIAKLRELILQLAVRGKLVPQDPNDEPASELLKKIEAEKRLLVSKRVIPKTRSLEAIGPEELPYGLPENWIWTRLGDIGRTQTGTTPKKSDVDSYGDDIPFLKPGDISWSRVDYGNEGLSKLGVEKYGRMAASGSSLMVCIGTIGKTQVIDRDCSFNQQINAVTPFRGVAPALLQWFLRSPYFQDAAWARASSTTISILNKGKWQSIPLPLPPLAEQKRIVAKVDELMALCDNLEAKRQAKRTKQLALNRASLYALTEPNGTSLAAAWRRVRDHFDHLYTLPETVADLRQTILQLAVMGRLVPQDPKDEPASELLQKIQAEKQRLIAEGTIRKTKALPAVDDVGDLPNTWEIRRLADVCVSIVDGSHNPPPRSSSGLPYITAKNVIGGRVELDGCTFISDEDAPAVTKRYVPRDGDVLLTCVGTIGRIAIVHGSERFAIDRNVAALRPHAVGIDPKYLEIVLRGPEMQRIISAASGSTAQPHIYLKEIRSLVCPLPPLAEQKRIVTKVDQLMTLCDDLEAKLQQAQTDADNLLAAIVHELTRTSADSQERSLNAT